MRRLLSIAALIGGLPVASAAYAGEQTVSLAVKNMTCASCPYIVKQTLAAVPGVSKAEISFEEKTATVTFDDEKTSVTALSEATAIAGFPSALRK
jgi:mercuric ion binding protein